MSIPGFPTAERVLDLLASEATEGLPVAEQAELEKLLAEHPEVDAYALAAAAAAIDLAYAEPFSEDLPADLAAEVRKDARAQLAAARPRPSARFEDFRLGGLVKLAAAAVLIGLVLAWISGSGGAGDTTSLAAARQALIAEAPDLVRAAWKPLQDARYAGVTGDVVWSSKEQRGYMRFAGLPANDPKTEQYQLWIVDPGRDKHPVDGGVFDAGSGEVIVAIDAKLAVGDPKAFVITMEQPGGVVVSDGPHLILAPVG